jgi:hypothetical protein
LEDKGKVPRRDFLRLGAVAGLGVAGSSVFLAACGGGGGGAAQEGEGGSSCTLAVLSEELKVSRERVRQLQRQAEHMPKSWMLTTGEARG